MQGRRSGETSRDQHSVRGLLIIVFVPIVIVLGMLASAVLGNGEAVVDPAAPPATDPAPAPPALRGEPAAAVAPAPAAATPPAAPRSPAAGARPAAAARPAVPLPAPARRTAGEPSADYAPPGAERVDVGSGPHGAAIFRKPGISRQPGPVVIFLHGWVAIDARRYGSWIGHLVHGGTTVVYPAYQTKPAYDTITPLTNVLAGVRVALEHVQVAPGRLVVAGHSTGGALAADYAAVAADHGLPAPAAVFSVYPGRKLRHLAVAIPSAELGTIAPGTRVVAYAGERDTAVGRATAKRIAAQAVRADAELRIVRDDAVDDHSAPRRFDGAAQRTFWEPLDALVAGTAENAADARIATGVYSRAVTP